MIPILATALITALVLGFPLHIQARRAKAAESRARRAWADHEQVVASKDEALTHLRGIVDAVVAENRSLAEMRDLERTKHAIVLAELERHEAEHTCLPSLDAVRANQMTPWEARILREADAEQALAVVPDNVTRLRGRGRA